MVVVFNVIVVLWIFRADLFGTYPDQHLCEFLYWKKDFCKQGNEKWENIKKLDDSRNCIQFGIDFLF